MKKRESLNRHIGLITTALILSGVTSMTTFHTTAQATDAGTNSLQGAALNQQVPVPKLIRTIDLSHIGSVVAVRQLSFSPDSRYLAIVVDPELGKTDIVVWDMEQGKPQSRIHCPYQYGVLPGYDLLWSRDGKVISFGAKKQWNPMTGEDLPDNPAIGHRARLNKDGTKMLTLIDTINTTPYIHVYDTTTWALQVLSLDGFWPDAANWTADGKIYIDASLTHELYSKVTDGYQPKDFHDVAVRLMDPSGKDRTKNLWFPAKETGNSKTPYEYALDSGGVVAINLATNKLLLGSGVLIDGKTLEMDKSSQVFFKQIFDGESNFLISKDGQRMFTKGAQFKYGGHQPTPHRVIDLSSKKVISEFGGLIDYGGGFALSGNSSMLAIGNRQVVQIFQVK